jgi:hypothetical protein
MKTANINLNMFIAPMVIIALFLDGPLNYFSTGKAPDEKEKKLNDAKNRSDQPSAAQIDRAISLDAMLNSKDDESLFPTNSAAEIEAYLYDVELENSSDPNNSRIILYLSSGKATKLADCAIAEVTPALRKLHTAWTLSYFKNMVGKRVTVTGWTLFNYLQTNVSYASHPNGLRLQRHTVWEIQPVTNIKLDE